MVRVSGSAGFAARLACDLIPRPEEAPGGRREFPVPTCIQYHRANRIMLLSITTTCKPATDLGFLLHKHPDRLHSKPLSFGTAHVFYPEASDQRCTAVLFLEVDPVALARADRGAPRFALQPYVNDRPYAAGSFLSVAIGRVLASALKGRSAERQELADTAIPLEAWLPVLPCRGGERTARLLFEPLGYEVECQVGPLDETNADWGDSPYVDLRLKAEVRLADLLTHIDVLVPILDDEKHYWVGDDEVQKLLRRGEGWLNTHPEKELITRRYLKHQRGLTRRALAALAEAEPDDSDNEAVRGDASEEEVEKPIRLDKLRRQSVIEAIKASGAQRVLDLGCGGGKLLRSLIKERQFSEILGLDASVQALELASRRLRMDRMPELERKRIRLCHGSLTYRDKRLMGFDAAAVVEVIEHLDPFRLESFTRALFECAKPGLVVLTTPNGEYNALFEGMKPGAMRHPDHRFEWTREEFRAWATGVSGRFGYTVEFTDIGPVDQELGPPTQMGVFERCA